MNNFETLYNHVMLVERGYNPNDQGAETYSGIWRGAQAQWSGWKKLDAIKRARTVKRGESLPELEADVIAFYKDFWKPVQVDRINEPRIAALLVDMKTQHGRWARIVYAGLNGMNPLQDTTPKQYGDQEIKMINDNPAKSYNGISLARLQYVKGVALKNEADRSGIIARAKKYVNDAATFIKANPGSSAAGMLLLVATFFF